MIFLGIAGLIAILGGGILSAVGSVLEGEENQRQAEFAAQKLEAQGPVYEAQQRAIKAEMEGLTSQYRIEQKQLITQQIGIQEAGASAKGSAAASGGVGNVGGLSVLRRATTIQEKVDRAMQGVTLQRESSKIQHDVRQTQLTASLASSNYEEYWGYKQAEEYRRQGEVAESYGWLSAAGDLLGTAGNVLTFGSKFPWG